MAHKVQGSEEANQNEKGRNDRRSPKNTSRHQGKRITQLRQTTSHK